MNRSRRSAAAIAAACFGMGWAVVAAAVATADAGRDGRSDPSGVAAVERTVRHDAAPGDLGPGVRVDRTRLVGRRTARADEWPCPWPWPYWPVPVNWKTYNRNSNAEIAVAAAQLDIRPAVGIDSPALDPVLEGMLDDLASSDYPDVAPDGPAGAVLTAPLSVVAAMPAPRGGPMPPLPPTPTQPAPVTPPVSAPPPPAPRQTEIVAAQPSLAHLATLALPGLAGLAGLTGVGSYLGYRQAKAGFALRAAGTARFLA